MLSCGDTFLTGDGDEDNFHLWVILTPATEGEVVTVSIVTARKRSERLVVIKPGEHPFINRESVVAYYYAEIRFADDIEVLFKSKMAKKREPVSEELLKRIRDGLVDSDFTPNQVRSYFKDVMGL